MNPIFEGSLNTENNFLVYPLSSNHLKPILNVQKHVVDHLKNKESFQPLELEEYQYILQGKGLMIGAFVEERLVAFLWIDDPKIDENHLGLDLGLAREELSKVIYYEVVVVHPSYRGNQLQKILSTLILQELSKLQETYSYLCCTVAPFNIASLVDKFAHGMEILALKEKYGGHMRYVLAKELAGKRDRDWSQVESIRMDDIEGQQKLLAEGWRGFDMENRNDEYWVVFGR